MSYLMIEHVMYLHVRKALDFGYILQEESDNILTKVDVSVVFSQ